MAPLVQEGQVPGPARGHSVERAAILGDSGCGDRSSTGQVDGHTNCWAGKQGHGTKARIAAEVTHWAVCTHEQGEGPVCSQWPPGATDACRIRRQLQDGHPVLDAGSVCVAVLQRETAGRHSRLSGRIGGGTRPQLSGGPTGAIHTVIGGDPQTDGLGGRGYVLLHLLLNKKRTGAPDGDMCPGWHTECSSRTGNGLSHCFLP